MTADRDIQRERIKMHTLERASRYVEVLEQYECKRSSVDQQTARRAIARRLRVSHGTLENIRRGRLKAIAWDVGMKLHSAVEAALKREIEDLERELHDHHRGIVAFDPDALAEAETLLARAKAKLT
jgi:hypothetical protein